MRKLYKQMEPHLAAAPSIAGFEGIRALARQAARSALDAICIIQITKKSRRAIRQHLRAIDVQAVAGLPVALLTLCFRCIERYPQ